MGSAVPWIAGVAVASVFVLLWRAYLRADLRFQIWRGGASATSGPFVASERWRPACSATEAVLVVRRAILDLGGTPVVDTKGSVHVYGWVGSALINQARWAQYQVLVTIGQDAQGQATLTRSVRPRLLPLRGSEHYSRQWLRRLTDVLREQTGVRPSD